MAEQNPGTDKAAKSTFSLLSLPPELWSHICRMAVPHDQVIDIQGLMSKQEVWNAIQQPPITRTCKTIREETIDMFYTNSFVFFDNDDEAYSGLFHWLGLITTNERMRKLLPKMVIRSRFYLKNPWCTEKCRASGICLEQVGEQDAEKCLLYKVVPVLTTVSL
ncbi:hypothetical protein LTR56_009592 [Elasticomyces elasticus]|nr:hypothetical protein LTR56_009592 [Elasticomyces elasticus]KAK3657271.1 hypothetical protein LTR22_009445 [Elasticomyces elasticus]KAK4922182.1 hypothetical protein LTR49_010403 [Elasticomyces elasticus]KAK5760879.1 hypothetical protein LTS12_009055 [Elasticomyces elasticus]